MRGWTIRLLLVVLCLCLAVPALAAEQQGESVWAKYNLKMYGHVKFDMIYDDAQFPQYNDYIGIPGDSRALGIKGQENDSTDFNPRDVRLGWVASHGVEQWGSRGVVELDFYGSPDGAPRLRLGYGELSNKDTGTSVRAGQDWNPVLQLNPSTIDFGIMSNQGNLWQRRPQLTARQNVDLGDTGGLEFLASAYLSHRTDTGSQTYLPWFMGRVAYSFGLVGGKHMVALDAGWQRDKPGTYTAPGNLSNTHIDRYLLGGEFKFDFNPVLVKGEVWMGQGIGGDFVRGSLDTYTSGGKTRAWDAWGGWVDATYKIMPKWSVTAGAGLDKPDQDGYSGVASNSTYIRNYSYFANTWYTIIPDVKVGFEFTHVEAKRNTAVAGTGSDYTDTGNRMNLSLYYGF
jgi:hypothetical protein